MYYVFVLKSLFDLYNFLQFIFVLKGLYSDRQKYGINSLKMKQNFFKKIFGQVNFSL
jgi:hypothetical protein